MGFQMKKYAQMSEEVESLDAELAEQLKKLRSDIEALDWDASKVNMSTEDREVEFKRITAGIANARSVHQVRYSQRIFSVSGGRGPHIPQVWLQGTKKLPHHGLKSVPVRRLTEWKCVTSGGMSLHTMSPRQKPI